MDQEASVMPVLVADVGGTNVRFALCANGELNEHSIKVFTCNNYDSFEDAVRDYIQISGASIDTACMAIAAPVNSELIKLTNHHWEFNKQALKNKLKLATLKIINDFTAQALALPSLPNEVLVKIGGGKAMVGAPKLVMGPGSGLGVSVLVPVADKWLALSGEGGHAALSGVTQLDAQILAILHRTHQFVSWESVLCGSGLENLFQAHSVLAGATQTLHNYEITEQAVAGECLPEITFNHFCELLGRAASNAALITGAQGGVYIAGGILPQFPDFFAKSAFRRAFETNDKMGSYLQDIPTFLVLSEHAGLIGACNAIINSWA